MEIDGQRTYLGSYGTPASRQRYDRLIAEWLANGRRLLPRPEDITIHEVCAHFLAYIERRVKRPANYLPAVRVLRSLYGDSPTSTFGPLALKAVRQSMLAQGWSRRYVNQNVGFIKQMFKVAASDELIPVAVYQALGTVAGLRTGEKDVTDHDPVTPVPLEHVEAVKPYVSKQVWAMGALVEGDRNTPHPLQRAPGKTH